jgi:hypothetical protein
VEQQQAQENLGRRAAILEAFDSMSDESQSDALYMLQAMAVNSPKRAMMSLRLVASNGGNGSSEGFR